MVLRGPVNTLPGRHCLLSLSGEAGSPAWRGGPVCAPRPCSWTAAGTGRGAGSLQVCGSDARASAPPTSVSVGEREYYLLISRRQKHRKTRGQEGTRALAPSLDGVLPSPPTPRTLLCGRGLLSSPIPQMLGSAGLQACVHSPSSSSTSKVPGLSSKPVASVPSQYSMPPPPPSCVPAAPAVGWRPCDQIWPRSCGSNNPSPPGLRRRVLQAFLLERWRLEVPY